MYATEAKTLLLFNERAEVLESFSFVRKFLEHKIPLRIAITVNNGLIAEQHSPDKEAISAFVSLIRQFTLNKDPISISNIRNIYENIPASAIDTQSIIEVSDRINIYLDTKNPLDYIIHGISYSYREIFDVFVYGNYIHITKNKRELYEKWMSIQGTKELLETRFNMIIMNLFKDIVKIKEINLRTLAQLT